VFLDEVFYAFFTVVISIAGAEILVSVLATAA